jgi:hypothetical protein
MSESSRNQVMIPVEPASDVAIPRITLKSSNNYIVAVERGTDKVLFLKVHNPPFPGEDSFDLSPNDSIFVTQLVPIHKNNGYDFTRFYTINGLMQFTYSYYKSLNPKFMENGNPVPEPATKQMLRNIRATTSGVMASMRDIRASTRNRRVSTRNRRVSTRNGQGLRISNSRGGKKTHKNRK